MAAISDEEAKAIQEVAKATGKGIDAAEKAGGFFSRVFGQPIEDSVGRYWGDKVAADRKIKAIELALKVQEKLDQAGIKDIRALPNKISVPLIEAATLEDDDEIAGMFVNLLASAVDPSEEEIEKKYVSVLSEISGKEARLLKFLYEHKFTENPYPGYPIVRQGIKQFRAFKFSDLNRHAVASDDSIRSLMRLGILKSVRVDMTLEFDNSGAQSRSLLRRAARSRTQFGIYTDTEQTTFTEFGLDLSARVIDGQSISQINAKDAERDI